ncbi:MAG: hypothetical protein EBZ74_01370 [Planctomycetia bacterium]|nr:hypothetical protein [Planctomycetia bacterium]
MRPTLLAVAALAILRIVVGLHFFLEGLSHLRDADWSSAGFRKAAVGPLADWYRKGLPETGDWSGTVGAANGRPAAEAGVAWKDSIVANWKKLLANRRRLVPLDGPRASEAERLLEAAGAELDGYVAGLADEFGAYRLELDRLAEMRRSPASRQVPFARDRVAKKQKELAGQAAGWMRNAAAIGTKLVAGWDEQLSSAERLRASEAAEPSALWKADRFVSWSLVTIGACLVLGLGVKFNALGAACFLASVIASQPFWVPGAQATYDQWVELAALLAIAALPVGGWSGLDYFLKSWCPLSCCGGRCSPA